MIFLDSQKSFQVLIDQKIRGQNVTLDAPYNEEYPKWELQNEEKVYKLSAEERTEDFSGFIENERKAKVNEIIQKSDLEDEKKDNLKRLSQRGQVILASTDGGKNFDTLITKQDLEDKKIDATAYTFFSPTLKSSSTKPSEILDEQTFLHVVTNLKNSPYQVKSFQIKDGDITVELSETKTGETGNYRLNLITFELLPTLLSAKAHNQNTIRPEDYGQIEVEEAEKELTENQKIVSRIIKTEQETNKDIANRIKKAGIFGIAGAVGINELQKRNAIAKIFSKQRHFSKPAINAKEFKKPAFSTNVMASKNAVTARVGLQKMEQAKEQKHEEELKNQPQKIQAEPQQTEPATQGMSQGSKMGIGAGVASGGILAGTFGMSLFASLHNIIS